MPLSDHEQKILDEIEARLAAEDPKFARSTSAATPRGIAIKRIKRASLVFIAGFVLFAIALTGSIGVAAGESRALFVMAGVAVVSLVWGVFNTWELIFRIQWIDHD